MVEPRADPARSFGRRAEAYDRGRPGWPEQALDLVPVEPAATALDLGAGTGKLTRVLVPRYRSVYALEPLPAMRSLLGSAVPEATVLGGRAEEIPLETASLDAVFVAQAFHWFANEAAVAEIARVLRPDGTLALLWQEPHTDVPSPLPIAYRRRFGELRSEIALPNAGWQDVLLRGPFGALSEASVSHEQISGRPAVLDFAASQSWITCRPEPEQQRVLAELAALLPAGEYRFELRVDVFWTRRLA